ncbi:polysaccharide biosynthesis protein [Salinarimonas chemoclinalis]|uniref:polysaccharide biosynthesis protein n=1 Tax=Salinarimonas chemoclinalis TaxID=3241599 RepID=UPI0035562727
MTERRKRTSWKRVFAGAHDATMAGLALFLALAARFESADWPDDRLLAIWIVGFVLISAVTFRVFGLGRGMWRFASISDLRAIVLASTVAVLAFLLVLFLVNRLEGFPRAAALMTWFTLVVLLGAPRLLYRALKDGVLPSLRREPVDEEVETLLVVGTAAEADKVIRTYGLETAKRYKVRGIVDFTPKKAGRDVRGVPIIGHFGELEEIVARLARGGTTIDAIVLAPNENKARLQEATVAAAKIGLPVRRIAKTALTGSEPSFESVTLEDLLGRRPVSLKLDYVRSLVHDRVVLVTGAGGSIGSEIARQIASHGPARLIVLDHSEYALYEIDQELGTRWGDVPRRAVIASVRDVERIGGIMATERPHVVFHAAALKHVPLVEANVCEGVLTNVVGTRVVADAAMRCGAAAMVLISTDKAIRPTNVMGATKRAAEVYCQALDLSGSRTRFHTVRFGNVLGSTGSVVPLFKRQIMAGGPVTVTHPEMRRYFMTIREATELVMQAAGVGMILPDRGRIFVLDMGEPVRIVDLARTLIALAGLRPDEDIKISYSGLRPGEKLFEELFDPSEVTVPAGVDGVFVASVRAVERDLAERTVERLEAAAESGDARAARRLLAELVPELPVDPAHDRRQGDAVSSADGAEPAALAR